MTNIYDFFIVNTLPCIILYQLIILLSIVLFFVFLTIYLKTKKICWILPILISLLGVYQIVPHFYEVKAVRSNTDEGYVKNYKKAVKLSIFPIQKALMCEQLASYYSSRNLPLAIEYYENIFKYTKNYESIYIWTPAVLTYYTQGNFDKTIEIAETIKLYSSLSKVYIMQKDYQTALVYINKEIERRPESWYAYSIRANIYSNLDRAKESSQDCQKALSLCKYENQIREVENYCKNKSAIHDEWVLRRTNFKQKCWVL